MKIWCCLCFTDDDEEEEQRPENSNSNKMKEGISAIEDESEGNIGNVSGDVAMQLGRRNASTSNNTGILPFEIMPQAILDDVYSTMSGENTNVDASVPSARRHASRRGPVIRGTRRFDGESSGGSCSAGSKALAVEDSQHKRAKVYSASTGHYVTTGSSDAGASSSLAGGDYNVSQGSSVPGTGEIFCNYFTWNSGGDGNPFDASGGNDGGDDNGTPKTEDLEIRMDLTDDLLHMVFSFLDYVDLCRAAIVCRQWRAASAHEDFWRCLNFENRKISVEQLTMHLAKCCGALLDLVHGGDVVVVDLSIGMIRRHFGFVKNYMWWSLKCSILELAIFRADMVIACMMGSLESSFDLLYTPKKMKGLVEDVCQRYPNATEVNIYGAPAIHLLVMKAVSLLRNLEALTLGRGQLGDAFFHALADCSMLKSLNVNDATLGNGVQEIPINHDQLRRLEITKCRVMRVSIRCPQLEHLSLKRSNMAQAVLNCPLLHLLDIASCHKLSDAAIRLAATSCPQLESLDMSNCSCVSDESLREIALSCANLRILNSSYCPNISLESVRLPMLTVLQLHSCEGITSASMAAISHSYMLEVLELDNCNLLTSVSLELPRLQNIRLVHCRKFADLNLRAMMLSSIMVSNCAALHRINITSNSLQKQENLTSLALQCQCLQEVDLTDCESLTNSVCEVFSDGGGCPMLKSLVLDNCEGLTVVRFCSTSLVSLSLVGCRAITALELKCPILEKVCLDGCDHIESASFVPVALQSLNLGICPKLSTLGIEALHMVVLELKGCGVLSDAYINCPLLTSLDASFCSQLKDDCLSATTTSCPLIESLILMSCQSIGPDGLYSLRSLQNLTMLDLSYTFLTNLEPVFESCLQLKVLKLQACKYLTNTSLESLYKKGSLPALQELDLSYGTLCQSAIEELLAYCTHLTHVSLNGCGNMHDLNWGSSGCQPFESPSVYNSCGIFPHENIHESIDQPNRLLQNLNCVGCPNIRKVFIPPQARCFHLSSLNLSLSANLKEVDVACFNLCFLNLSNCCSLETLKLDCPKLTSLFLQSCNIDEEGVESAITQCGMLETLDVRFCPKICSTSMGRLRAACPSLKRIFSSLTTS
ncbi:F-box/LRR-repeat protein 15 [Citrus sinensis]|nr:F-box/LRR-repeat protein 15 [Citrus sinensis]